MKEKIIKELKKMEGSLLGIGIDDKLLLDIIEENDKIDLCYILSNKSNGESSKKFKLFKNGRNKTVNIKKLKKYFKKKSIGNVICDYNVLKKHIRSFIPGSVYINSGKLYIYGNVSELKELDEKYKRYTNDVKLEKKGKSFLLIVDNSKTKNNFIKDILYQLSDLFNDGLDFLTELLSN